jgi:hypothetical protein
MSAIAGRGANLSCQVGFQSEAATAHDPNRSLVHADRPHRRPTDPHGAIHILDYKPHAKSERPIAQLMVYALALSRRTDLRIFDFVCAWFDEHHYYEFYPLHVVHKRRIQSPHVNAIRTSVK